MLGKRRKRDVHDANHPIKNNRSKKELNLAMLFDIRLRTAHEYGIEVIDDIVWRIGTKGIEIGVCNGDGRS